MSDRYTMIDTVRAIVIAQVMKFLSASIGWYGVGLSCMFGSFRTHDPQSIAGMPIHPIMSQALSGFHVSAMHTVSAPNMNAAEAIPLRLLVPLGVCPITANPYAPDMRSMKISVSCQASAMIHPFVVGHGGVNGNRTHLTGFAVQHLTARSSRHATRGRGTVPTLQRPAELKSARMPLVVIPVPT